MNSHYTQLPVWQKADELAREVYFITQEFPNGKSASLVTQLRKAALSLPEQLSEGMQRADGRMAKQSLAIAFGSLAETEYLLEFCYRLKYIEQEKFAHLEGLRKEVGSLLWNLYHSNN